MVLLVLGRGSSLCWGILVLLSDGRSCSPRQRARAAGPARGGGPTPSRRRVPAGCGQTGVRRPATTHTAGWPFGTSRDAGVPTALRRRFTAEDQAIDLHHAGDSPGLQRRRARALGNHGSARRARAPVVGSQPGRGPWMGPRSPVRRVPLTVGTVQFSGRIAPSAASWQASGADARPPRRSSAAGPGATPSGQRRRRELRPPPG